MIYGSVCSGIEAATSAWHQLGWKCAFVAEIEKFPSEVLKARYPDIPNYGDITKFKEWPDHSIDVLIGGTPCQSFSVAGLRSGIRDPRGNLALVFLAIADRYRPRWILWENVPGVHSSWTDEAVRPPTEEEARMLKGRGLDPGEYEYAEQRNDFDCFLSGMEELGYGVATAILDAQYFGLAQRRERVFVVGHIGGQWQRAAAVLFDTACLRGDSAPSREKGQRIAPTVEGRAGRSGCNSFATSGGPAVAPTLQSRKTAGGGLGGDFESSGGLVAHSLKAEGFDASEDGTGRGTPIVPDVVGALSNGAHNGAGLNGQDAYTGRVFPVAYRSTGNCGVMAFQEAQTGCREYDTAGTLRADGPGHDPVGPRVRLGSAVRRLTPRECERLQGFPDGWTKLHDKTPDGPRYRAIGNSMAVPVITWIGRRIELIDSIPCSNSQT